MRASLGVIGGGVVDVSSLCHAAGGHRGIGGGPVGWHFQIRLSGCSYSAFSINYLHSLGIFNPLVTLPGIVVGSKSSALPRAPAPSFVGSPPKANVYHAIEAIRIRPHPSASCSRSRASRFPRGRACRAVIRESAFRGDTRGEIQRSRIFSGVYPQ